MEGESRGEYDQNILYIYMKFSRNKFCFVFSRQGFSVALESALELALVGQVGLELTEIRLPLPPECATTAGLKE